MVPPFKLVMQSIPPGLLLFGFMVFWFGGAAVMSRIAGWHALSALYPAPLRLQGDQFRFCSASMGPESFPIAYRRCVRVFLTSDGFGMCLMLPFRFYSPPFVVPWSAVVSCVEKQSFTTRKVTFSFAGTDKQVTVAGELGQLLKTTYRAQRGDDEPSA